MARYLAKPTTGLELRYGEHLCNGLVWCVFPGIANQQELTAGGKGTLLTSGNWLGKTPVGYGINSTSNSTGGAYWPWVERIGSITNNHTICILANITSMASSGCLFSIPYRATGFTAPFAAITLQRNAAGSAGSTSFADGTTQRSATSDTGFIATTDGLTMYGLSRAGTVATFYRNGAVHGAVKSFVNANAVDLSNKQPPTVINGTSTSPSFGMQGSVPFVGLWNRCLSTAEMREVAADPWQLVRRRSLFPVAAGGGATAFPWHYYQQMMAG